MSTTRRIFPEAFKRQAVDRLASSDLSVEKVATELGLHETVLRRWMKQFSAQATGTARRPITQAPAPSSSHLVSEGARLRREAHGGYPATALRLLHSEGNRLCGHATVVVPKRLASG